MDPTNGLITGAAMGLLVDNGKPSNIIYHLGYMQFYIIVFVIILLIIKCIHYYRQ